MPLFSAKIRGFKEMRGDVRVRMKYLAATWALGILLVSFAVFAVYNMIVFANRMFETEPGAARDVTMFDLDGAQKIRRLEHLWVPLQ